MSRALAGLPALETVVLFPGALPTAADFSNRFRRNGGPQFQVHLRSPDQPLAEAVRLADPSLMHLSQSLTSGTGSALLVRTEANVPPEQRLRTCARILATLMDLGAAAALISSARKVLAAPDLLEMLAWIDTWEGLAGIFLSHHTVLGGSTSWLHTHGMEQFGCPDLELSCPARLIDAAGGLLWTGVRSMMSGAAAIQAGATVFMPWGAGHTAFSVESAQPRQGHSWGRYGALALVPQP